MKRFRSLWLESHFKLLSRVLSHSLPECKCKLHKIHFIFLDRKHRREVVKERSFFVSHFFWGGEKERIEGALDNLPSKLLRFRRNFIGLSWNATISMLMWWELDSNWFTRKAFSANCIGRRGWCLHNGNLIFEIFSTRWRNAGGWTLRRQAKITIRRLNRLKTGENMRNRLNRRNARKSEKTRVDT